MYAGTGGRNVIRSLSAWLRTDRGRTYRRYVLASVASVVVGQAVLGVCFGWVGWPARTSNLVAFVVAGLLSYALHRRWTWRKVGRSRVLRELVPFWLVAVAGLALSTWAVGAMEAAAPRVTSARLIQTLLVMGASLTAFGALWVVKFVAFDRFIFGDGAPTTESGSRFSSP
jgi:putative flippase GtrA